MPYHRLIKVITGAGINLKSTGVHVLSLGMLPLCRDCLHAGVNQLSRKACKNVSLITASRFRANEHGHLVALRRMSQKAKPPVATSNSAAETTHGRMIFKLLPRAGKHAT